MRWPRRRCSPAYLEDWRPRREPVSLPLTLARSANPTRGGTAASPTVDGGNVVDVVAAAAAPSLSAGGSLAAPASACLPLLSVARAEESRPVSAWPLGDLAGRSRWPPSPISWGGSEE